jgi:hypothetical protein
MGHHGIQQYRVVPVVTAKISAPIKPVVLMQIMFTVVKHQEVVVRFSEALTTALHFSL